MDHKDLVLVVTGFVCVDAGNVSYAEKEAVLIEKLDLNKERVKFFHPMFQSESMTLNRMINQEQDSSIHVMFHPHTPPEHVNRVMSFMSEKTVANKVVYSTARIIE